MNLESLSGKGVTGPFWAFFVRICDPVSSTMRRRTSGGLSPFCGTAGRFTAPTGMTGGSFRRTNIERTRASLPGFVARPYGLFKPWEYDSHVGPVMPWRSARPLPDIAEGPFITLNTPHFALQENTRSPLQPSTDRFRRQRMSKADLALIGVGTLSNPFRVAGMLPEKRKSAPCNDLEQR